LAEKKIRKIMIQTKKNNLK